MDLWIVWLVAACVLGVLGTRPGGFHLAPLATGAALAAVVGLLGVGARLSVAVFAASAGIVFVALRPVARRRRRQPAAIRTAAASLVGRPAIVIERIANDEGVGCVKIDSEVWTARSYDGDEVIDAGERVEVVDIRGATALVMH